MKPSPVLRQMDRVQRTNMGARQVPSRVGHCRHLPLPVPREIRVLGFVGWQELASWTETVLSRISSVGCFMVISFVVWLRAYGLLYKNVGNAGR